VLFAWEVLTMLVGKELLNPEWAERLLSWRHSGFNVQSLVRTGTKAEAERVGKSMIRPLVSLERLIFLEQEGKVGYRWGRKSAELQVRKPDDDCGLPDAGFRRGPDHLKLTFVTERPPPERVFQDLPMVADPPVDYFL
jgi:hypothetical protein